MKKINGNVKNAEMAAFGALALDLAKKRPELQGDDALQGLLGEVSQKSAELTTIINGDKIRSGLEERDGERDEALRRLGTMLEGWAANPLPEISGAAAPFKKAFEKYGKKTAGLAYLEETALLDSLLEDFEKLGVENAAQLAGLSQIVSILQGSQDGFKAAYVQFSASSAKEKEKKSASSVKKELLSLFNDALVPYLDGQTKIKSAKHEAFARLLSAEIEKLNANVEGRKKAEG